ncbi:MAG: hypothetical protein AMXMBFR13_13340 [Phycisphaerae bacterium]|jgi:hypothetical protein
MKRLMLAASLLIGTVLPLGCGDGMAYTRRERQVIHERIREIDRRQLVDDIDYLLLQEQPTRLSRWAIE